MTYAQITTSCMRDFAYMFYRAYQQAVVDFGNASVVQRGETAFSGLNRHLRDLQKQMLIDDKMLLPSPIIDKLKEINWHYDSNAQIFYLGQAKNFANKRGPSASELSVYFEILDLLINALTAERQEEYADDERRLAREGVTRTQQIHFSAAKAVMRLTSEGQTALQRLEDRGVRVVFTEKNNSDRHGSYSWLFREVEVVTRPNERNSLQNSETLVHEMEHNEQHVRFPELFPWGLSVVDKFLSMKLEEWMAHNRHHSHAGKAATFMAAKDEMFGRGPVRNSPAQNYLATHARQPASPLDLLFDQSFVNWRVYETKFIAANPEFLELYIADGFKETVAASRFLQPDFLERFCVDAQGRSIMSTDKAGFRERLIDGICTLHVFQPRLSRENGPASYEAHKPTFGGGG